MIRYDVKIELQQLTPQHVGFMPLIVLNLLHLHCYTPFLGSPWLPGHPPIL